MTTINSAELRRLIKKANPPMLPCATGAAVHMLGCPKCSHQHTVACDAKNELRMLLGSHAAEIADLAEQMPPMVERATGRRIPDLTKREHVCEWQEHVSAKTVLTENAKLRERLEKAESLHNSNCGCNPLSPISRRTVESNEASEYMRNRIVTLESALRKAIEAAEIVGDIGGLNQYKQDIFYKLLADAKAALGGSNGH